MGCTESKAEEVQTIQVRSEEKIDLTGFGQSPFTIHDADGAATSASSGRISKLPNQTSEFNDDTYDLEIPDCDLGESLDCRRRPVTAKPDSGNSARSVDSGIYELEDDYSHVITELSPKDLISQVEKEFKPVENLELEVVGRACPRLLSGVQKSRMEEQRILQSLREEGFIAMPKAKATSGISFDIVDIRETDGCAVLGPRDMASRMPAEQLERLELRRAKYGKAGGTIEDIDRHLNHAEERRRMLEEQRARRAAEMMNLDRADEQMESLRQKHSAKMSTAMENRQKHLDELREKMKKKQERVNSIRLKKVINHSDLPVPKHITEAESEAELEFK